MKQFGHIETTEFPRLIQVDKASEFVQKAFQRMAAIESFEYPVKNRRIPILEYDNLQVPTCDMFLYHVV